MWMAEALMLTRPCDTTRPWAQTRQQESGLGGCFGPLLVASSRARRTPAVAPCLAAERERDYENIIRRNLEGIIPLSMHPRCSFMVALQVCEICPAIL